MNKIKKILVVAIVGVMIWSASALPFETKKIKSNNGKLFEEWHASFFVYVRATSINGYRDVVWNSTNKLIIMYNFDGTGMGIRTEVKRFGIPKWHVEGPQFGLIIGFIPIMYDPNAIVIEGYAFFIFCGKFSPTPLEVSPVYPKNDQKNVNITPILRWKISKKYDPTYLNFTLKLVGPGVGPNNKTSIYMGNKMSCDLKKYGIVLRYSEEYYWWIEGICTDTGKAIPCDPPSPWEFYTMPDPNPPYIPHDPMPWDGAPDVPVNANLYWQGGDPDMYDKVRYEIYLNTSTNLDKPIYTTDWKNWNETMIWYSPALLPQTTYYWKVVAEDLGGKRSESDMWTFTTGGD